MTSASGSPLARGGKVPVLQLVQQIGEIIAQGEDSGTPSQHTEVRSRLRSVLLQLLDVGVTSPTAGSRELGAVVQLLKLTLEKVPNWLTGDTNTLLLEILEKFMPRIARPLEPKIATGLVEAMLAILRRIAATDNDQFAALFKTLSELFEDVYAVAVRLSMDPTNSAQVKCNISSLAAADSAQQPLQLQFDGPAACDCMLQTLLRVLSQVVLLQPQSLASQLPASLLQGASCLLVCNSCGLQAAALDFVATVLLASSMPRPELRGLPDRLGATLQAFSLRQATCEPSVRAAWYQGLVKTLHALLNVISQSHDRRRALQQVASIALNESGSAEMGSAQQDALLQLFAEAVLKDPFILQSNVHALDCLKTCSQSSRTALLTAVRWCLDQVPVEQAQQALQQAARLGNGAMEAVIAKDGPQKTPASVKRRRTAKQADPMVVDSGGADAAASLPPGAVALATALVQAAKSLQKDTSNSSIQALADVLIMISPLAPSVALRLSSSALHSSRRLQTLLARGHSLTEESLGATFGVLVSCLDAAVAVHSQGESILQGDAESVLGATKEALYVGQNSNGKCAVARMAGALLAAQLDLVDCAATVLATLNGGNTTLDETAKAGRAALLPAAACLYSIKAGSGSEGQQASKQKSHPSNPFAPLLLEVAGSSDDRIRAAAAQGIRLAIEWAHDPGIMVCQAVRVAFSGGQGPPLPHDPAVRPSLTAAVSEWARPTLDALCGISPGMREEREAKAQAEAEARAHRRKQEQKEDAVVLLPPGPPPSLDQLAAVREFLVHGSLGQLEHSWGLAKWLMAQTASPAPAVRAAALRGCEVFTSAHFLLAAYHKGSHPVHSHDRSAAADRCEQSAVNEIRSRSAAVIADLDVFEDQLQLATRVGCLMRTSVAQMLILTFLVHGLDFREPGPVAMAAQCMRGVALARKCSVHDLIFSTPKLLEHMGRQFPERPILVQELAELLGMSRRALAESMLPKALPALFVKGDKGAIEKMAKLAGYKTTQRMMLDYGHHPVAACLMYQTPPLADFMPLVEEVTGQDFLVMARAIMPRIITEMVLQTGAGHGWSHNGDLPKDAINHTAHMLSSLAAEAAERDATQGQGPETQSTAEFLAEGDHVTRMLKEFGDALDSKLPSVQGAKVTVGDVGPVLNTVRSVLVLVQLTGPYVGRFLPQFMVLLGAAVRPANHSAVRMQGLAGWLCLVRALTEHAPLQLSGIVTQIVVTLMDSLQESGAVGFAAARVVHQLIDVCREHFKDKLRSIPPLPQSPELRHVNTKLQEERGTLSTTEHVSLLLESLGNEALSVRSMALQELRGVLAARRETFLSLQNTNPALFQQLIGALLKSSEPEAANAASVAAQQACAECLGMLGATDPSRVQLEPQPPRRMCSTSAQLAIELITKHLVRLLKTAPSMQVLDRATLGIQDVLRCHATTPELIAQAKAAQAAEEANAAAARAAASKGKRSPALQKKEQSRTRSTTPQPDNNALFAVLPEEVQAIVRPYLDSKYAIKQGEKKIEGVVYHAGVSLRRWLALWLSQLTEKHASGEMLMLFRAVNPIIRTDIPTALFLAPYIVQNAVGHGSPAATANVAAEMQAVLKADATTRDGVLCMQAVFTLLDVLQRWCEEAKSSSAAAPSNSVATTSSKNSMQIGDSKEWGSVRKMLASIPKDTLARAAAQCGAHARALLQFEEHLRELRGGGVNPMASNSPSFETSEVSFLLEVYSRLEEADGLDGLVKLRAGGPSPEDQRLVAEKMGYWGEALSLYERDLARNEASAVLEGAGTSAPAQGPSPVHRGYLNCLLQMGHWQSLLTAVEGMAVQMGADAIDKSAAAQLAAMGTAAAWRLGRWDQLGGYLAAADAEFGGLDADARWEVRIARLLKIVAHGSKNSGVSEALNEEIAGARAEVMGPFSAAAMESYSRAYPHLVKLHMLQEVVDTAGCMAKQVGGKERRRALRWDERLSQTQASLTTQAPILALRRQLASLAGWSADAGQCWLQHAQLCRATGHYDTAVPAVLEASAAKVPGSSLERVELMYARGDAHRALSELRCLEVQLASGGGDGAALRSEAEFARYRARVLLRLAEWTAETGQGTREEVVGLFDGALALRKDWETGLFKYAVYLDQLMQDAKARQEGNSNAGIDRLDGKSKIKLGEDRPYLSFLPEVLRGYGKSIEAGHVHIYRSLPRLLTLWFEYGASLGREAGADREVEGAVMEVMRSFAKSVPMHCWLMALPQLISRICHRHQDVAIITRHIVTQVAVAYPQQALWALAAVSKSTVSSRRSAATAICSNAKRAAHSEEVRAVFQSHNTITEQLIKLCHLVPPANKRVISIKELSHLTRLLPSKVMMPTQATLTPALPPSPSAAFSAGAAGGTTVAERTWRPPTDIVTIAGIAEEIQVMASLQRPKRVVLIGSDGQQYGFLAKPKDDLRKDNRMMEVAGVVNRLFLENPGSRRRNLHLRRFAVLPLTEESGLIEWVECTRTMRSCITDSLAEAGVDARVMNQKAKVEYDKVHKPGSNNAAGLLRWFENMIASYPPRLHRWFLHKFPEPAAWLNSRLAYTRTYAVWCVVGHVVGLGDRHGENVLIDMASGDSIQIDFGCLFDKGLVLAQPEMVPFRLTQNVVDAFGVTGVEGVYRRTFETTLGVLREHRDIFLSVMDTFVHDPLVDWAKKKERDTSEVENPQARDWLRTMEGRLRGTLLGVSSRPCMPLSVEGHTHRLIQEAGSKDNLSKMYIWWQAWY